MSQTQTQPSPYMGTAAFAERMQFLKNTARGEGFSLPSTIVPEGTTLIPYGEERQRALKADIDSLPDFETMSAVVRAQNIVRRPSDVHVSPSEIRMRTNGRLYNPANRSTTSGTAYTDTGFAHLAHYLKPATVRQGFANTLLALTPLSRSVAFNDFEPMVRWYAL